MFSVSYGQFECPVRVMKQGQFKHWVLFSPDHKENLTLSPDKTFNFTLHISNSITGVRERLTFVYGPNSVKPSGRTLRLFGAESTSKIGKLLFKGNWEGTKVQFVREKDLNLVINSVLKEGPWVMGW